MIDNVQMAIGDDGGNVILKFDESIDTIVLAPQNAAEIAEAITKAAYKCRYGFAPNKATQTYQVEKIRDKLISRVALMLNSPAKSHGVTAMHIVDVCLKEVL